MTWLVGSLTFLVGLLGGLLLTHWGEVKIRYELGLADVVNWLVVVVVAKLLHLYWQRKYSDARAEKDLLIQQVKETLANLMDTRGLFIQCYEATKITEEQARLIKWKLRNLSNDLHFLESAVGRCKRTASMKLSSLKESMFQYKEILTGRGFPDPYTATDWREQEVVHTVLRRELQELIFQINEA